MKLETIGDNAFYGTKISRIVLPQSVETLGDYVFDPYCIQRITISGARPNHVGSRSSFGSCSANIYYNFQNDDDAGSYSNYGLGQYLNWIDCNHTEKNPRTCASPTVCKACGALGATYYMPKHTYSGGTCEEPGVCTECGKVDTESLGHDFGEYVISDATCTKNETKTATCEKCGKTDTIEIPGTALGHDFANYSSNNDAKCNLDGTKSAKCTRCSVKNTVVDTGSAKDHTDVLLDSKPVTCTENGLTSGKKCSACKEMTVAQQVLPATGHVYSSGVDGTCNVCGIHRETTENRIVMHMFRMYDPNSGEHFYTGSEEERDYLVSVGWNYEGVGFTFSMTTGMPVYRLYDPINGEHLYTMNVEEKATLMAQGWNFEGIAFNSAYDTEVPQYRLHNPNASRGAYHFTASIEERDYLLSLGWEDQGIGFYSSWK